MLRVILEIILVLLVIRFIARLFLPIVVRQVSNNLHKKMNEQFHRGQQQKQSKPEGTIEVDYIPPPKKGKSRKNEGDFVDYEEIK